MEAVGARAATRGGPGGTDSVGKGERRGRKVTRERLGEGSLTGKRDLDQWKDLMSDSKWFQQQGWPARGWMERV